MGLYISPTAYPVLISKDHYSANLATPLANIYLYINYKDGTILKETVINFKFIYCVHGDNHLLSD